MHFFYVYVSLNYDERSPCLDGWPCVISGVYGWVVDDVVFSSLLVAQVLMGLCNCAGQAKEEEEEEPAPTTRFERDPYLATDSDSLGSSFGHMSINPDL